MKKQTRVSARQQQQRMDEEEKKMWRVKNH